MRVPMGSAALAEQAARLAADADAIMSENYGIFEKVNGGASRVVLLGPDGVVYKATNWVEGSDAQYPAERGLFDYLSDHGIGWCPDYWPYDDFKVMAMKRYDRCPKVADMTPEQHRQYWCEMQVISDMHPCNFGVDEDGSLVLLDGGGAHMAWAISIVGGLVEARS